MIEYADIVAAVQERLKINFPKVYRPEGSTKSGFDKPAFFVQLVVISENTYNDYSDKIVMIDIHYFAESKKNIEILKMKDNLNKVFKNTLEVKDRRLTLMDKRPQIIDNVLQFKFNLEFTDDLEQVLVNEEWINEDELNGNLGYTSETLETMKGLELNESEVD
jgi:hypothetical protein